MTITVTRLVTLVAMMFCFSLLPYYILQSIQAANSLWHPVCRSERDTEMFRRGQGKPEQLTLPQRTQSSWSIFKYAHYFILVVFWIDDSSGWIGYSFPQGWCHRGISRTCFRETLQIPFLNGSIDLLPHQWSKFSMERFLLWRASLVWWGICLWATVDLVPVYALICSILDASNTDLGSGRLQASGYVLSSHLTSQAPASTSNVPSTRARASAAHTILPPAINWCG